MEELLDNVLCDRTLTTEFMLWLQSDDVDIPRFKRIERCEFIPFFLNHVREKTLWLLSKNVKSSEPVLSERISKLNVFGKSANEHISVESSKGSDVKNAKCCETGKSSRRIRSFAKDARTFSADSMHRKFSERSKSVLNEIHFSSQENRVKPPLTYGFSLNAQKKNKTENLLPISKISSNSVPDINSIDVFPPVGSKNNEGKGRRRITPTPVQAANSSLSTFGQSHFSAPLEKVPNAAFKRNSIQETKGSDFHHEREMLRLTRNNLSQSSILLKDIKEATVVTINQNSPKSHTQYVVPDPQNICFIDKILVFTEIYDLLLVNALVPNVTSELFFMFELITSRVTSEDKPDDESSIFCSIHNCVYFAISLMEKRCDLLHMLDSSTLSSMTEIPFLCIFSPQLMNFLQVYCVANQEVSTKSYHLKSVPFLLEEDSRTNFPDDNAFYNFKKQRDLFYELLREWQQQSLDYTDSKYLDRFRCKAKLLVNLCPDSVNLYHLAKLIQSQLIASCVCLEVNEVYDELLSDIQKNFPGKIEKLQERFQMPLCVGGPTPPPTFYGIQSFFSELIQATASSALNQHLIDIFVYKITDLNNTNILLDNELSSFGTLKERYIFLLHTLRLLGKFLGYLYFLPYKTCKPLPLSMENYQLAVRKHAILPLDLQLLIKEAVINNKIILTVPWIVEFLSMMDSMAQNLEYIQEILKILISIYRGKCLVLEKKNIWFLRFIIGWLFDALNFPKKYEIIMKPLPFMSVNNTEVKGIDYVIAVDKQLIHSCCPYLVEFKVLVYNFLNGIKRRKRDVRKITPLSTSKLCSSSLVKQQMETQLEENFFFIHPTSMRKITEFVSERIASKVIGKIRLEVKNVKLKTVEIIFKSDQYQSVLLSNSASFQKSVDVVDTYISQSYEEIQVKVHDLIKFCYKDIENVMPLLLSDDIKQSVIDVCCKISFRLAVNKVAEWCDTNLTLDAMKCDIQNKVQQLSRKECGKTLNGDMNIDYFISILRHAILKVHSKSKDVTKEHLIQINSNITSILSCNDSLIIVSKTLLLLSIDLYIALLCFTDMCDEELNKSFILLWVNFAPKFKMENLFLCAHNMKFLLSSKYFGFSWELFIDMLNILLKRNVFNVMQLELCVSNLKQYDWHNPLFIKYLSHFQSTLSNHRTINHVDKSISSMQAEELMLNS